MTQISIITGFSPSVGIRNGKVPEAVQEEASEVRMSGGSLKLVWLINASLILSVFALLAVAHFNLVPFPKIGFYCEDPKISFKYEGDTISMAMLFGTTLLPPLFVMCLVEFSLKRTVRSFKQACSWYGQFLFGLLLLIAITEASKSIISEPRPHFLDTCRPDKAFNCTDKAKYITEYKCTNPDVSAYRLRDSIRSFPSGHSAFGFYLSVFLIMFLQIRIPESQILIVPWLQCLTFMWAIFCGLSRITDRRHHWWDVVMGAICGIILAAYSVRRLCRNFRCYDQTAGTGSENSGGSGRSLLSSTSSYTPPEEKDMRVVS